eukprot:578382-Rhodomonas_salina.1
MELSDELFFLSVGGAPGGQPAPRRRGGRERAGGAGAGGREVVLGASRQGHALLDGASLALLDGASLVPQAGALSLHPDKLTALLSQHQRQRVRDMEEEIACAKASRQPLASFLERRRQ